MRASCRRISLAFAAALLFNACATAPKVGVRADFEDATVSTVAVAPIWASSSFGLDETTFARIRETYEAAANEDLRQLGFQVISSDELTAQLNGAAALDELEDVSTFSDGIAAAYEPELYAREPREVSVLRTLHAQGRLPSKALFVSEIVYQSTGICTSDPREYNRLAEVVVPGSASVGDATPGPCIISHFQAKLVDTSTGRTMWQNRFLRELRAPQVDAQARERNIEATVNEVVRGEFGLGPLTRGPAVTRGVPR